MRWHGPLLLIVLMGAVAAARAEDEPAGSAVVVDQEGRETQATGIRFTAGVHRLSWLADPEGKTEDAKKGPLAVEVREVNSTTFAKGVVTYVPISHLQSAAYDYNKQAVTLGVKGLKEPLTGTLKFKGINTLSFTGAVAGKTTTFSAGVPGKSGVREVAFAGARPIPEPKATGTTWSIQIFQPKSDPKDPALVVRNLKLLYQLPGGVERVEESIPVRRGMALPLNGTLKQLDMAATDLNTNLAAAEAVTTAGPDPVTVIIPLTREFDKRTGTVVGFVGEVDAGWKLFPLHTVKTMTLTGVKKKVE